MPGARLELRRALLVLLIALLVILAIIDLFRADSFLRSPFETGGVANYFSFADPEIDTLLEQGARELNAVVRAKMYRDIERRILERAPLVPLYYTMEILAVPKRVRGLQPSPMGLANMDLSRVWFAPERRRP